MPGDPRYFTIQRSSSTLALELSLLFASTLGSACSSPPSDDGPSGGAGGSIVAMGGNGGAAVPSAGGTGGVTAQGGSQNSEGMGGTMLAMGGSSGSASNAGSSGMAGSMGMGVVGELCPEGALFCDDFEDDNVGQAPAAPWRNSSGSGGLVSVGTDRAFSGARAVHATAPTGANYRRAYFALDQGSSPIFPGAALEMYGRAMMFLEETPDTAIHWTFVQGEGRSADDTHNALYRYGGQQQGGAGLMANYETTMPVRSDCYQHSDTTMPAAQWTCVEWRFVVGSNEMQLWLDGTDVSDIHVIDRGEGCVFDEPPLDGEWLAPPAFQSLYLGWEHYQQPGNDINLWVDAVAVSNERLGCPAAP